MEKKIILIAYNNTKKVAELTLIATFESIEDLKEYSAYKGFYKTYSEIEEEVIE